GPSNSRRTPRRLVAVPIGSTRRRWRPRTLAAAAPDFSRRNSAPVNPLEEAAYLAGGSAAGKAMLEARTPIAPPCQPQAGAFNFGGLTLRARPSRGRARERAGRGDGAGKLAWWALS